MFILISLVKYIFVFVFSNARSNLISLEGKRHLGAVQQRCKIKTNKQISLTKAEEKLTSVASVSHPTYLFISTFTLIPLLQHGSEIHHTSPLALSLSHLCLLCFLSLSCFLIFLIFFLVCTFPSLAVRSGSRSHQPWTQRPPCSAKCSALFDTPAWSRVFATTPPSNPCHPHPISPPPQSHSNQTPCRQNPLNCH